MYGHIHVILKDLVVSVAGMAAWEKILAEAGLAGPGDEARVLDTVVHSDEVTIGLVGATCKVLQLAPDKALYVFGRHFVLFALRSGNAPFLKSQGATLHTFLENVNNLHHYLERDHPDARFPFVESKYNPETDSVLLTYLSVREGLKSLLVGVVEEIGNRLYGLEVTFEEAEVPEDLREAATVGKAAAWTVTWRPRPGGPELLESRMNDLENEQPRTARMSFPVLHTAMTEFMKLLRRSDLIAACRCDAEVVVKEVAEHIEVAVAFLDSDSDNEDEMMMTKSDSLRKLREVKNNQAGRPLEHILLRATTAQQVAAAWSDTSLPRCRAFWQSSTGRPEDYALSKDAKHVDVFVSHSWSPPENWKIVMGDEISYADVKSTTLAVMAKDIALTKNRLEDWGDVTLWVDKACIPQDIEHLKESCINLIEKFIHHCDHVCVIFTWSYLERLWCVFEWACVLVDKDPQQVWLQNELFVTEQTMPLYIDSIRYFSLKRAKCFLESDRAILTKKIDETYTSHRDFEELVKATATALMARSMAFRAGRSTTLRDRFFTPWVDLASELGFKELADALGSCRALQWREEAVLVPMVNSEMPVLLGRQGSHMGVSASKYHQRINQWFDNTVSAVLFRMRTAVVIV